MTRAIFVTCEHGGNRVPRAYRSLFERHRRLLESHRGYDPGALELARALGRHFDAPVVVSTITRLLVELNRYPHHRGLFSDLTVSLDPATKQEILTRHYHPYRRRVETALRELIGGGRSVLHLSAHSFAPVLNGEQRKADVGLLYDPRRSAERELCGRWSRALRGSRPELRVRLNHPYRGTADGLTTFLRKLFLDEHYLGIEIEVSQKWTRGSRKGWKSLREALIDALVDAQ